MKVSYVIESPPPFLYFVLTIIPLPALTRALNPPAPRGFGRSCLLEFDQPFNDLAVSAGFLEQVII